VRRLSSNGTKSDPSPGPEPRLVREHLSRVLAFPEFAAAPQLSAFLTYIVERKIEGAEDRIKAYSIATEALGRPQSFDPQHDPIVRVQARRVRQALRSYYATPDADGSMRIEMPVGGYAPEFRLPAAPPPEPALPETPVPPLPPVPPAAPEPALTAKPRPEWMTRLILAALVGSFVAVVTTAWANLSLIGNAWDQFAWQQPAADPNPLGMPALVVSVASERQIPGWFSPELFAKGVETNLSKFDEFVVLAPLERNAISDTDYRLDLVFTGTPAAVIGTSRLMRGNSGQIVWTNRFTVPEDSIDSYELIDPVRRLASTLGQPYGVLYSRVLSDPNRNPDQVCLLSGYEWFQNPEKEAIEPIRQCLNDVLERKPGNHVAYMMLAYIHVARFRWGTGDGPLTELAQALNMVKRAIALKPESAGTQQALMEVQWAREKFDLAEAAGRKAVALNPNSSDVIADFGCRLIYSGKYSEGSTYTERAAHWNVLPPAWHQFCRFVAAYNTGSFEQAGRIADQLDGQPGPESLLPVVLMEVRAGNMEKAAAAIQQLLAYDPGYGTDPGASLAKIGLLPVAADPLIAGLRAAIAAAGS